MTKADKKTKDNATAVADRSPEMEQIQVLERALLLLEQQAAALAKRVEELENLIVGTSEFHPTTLLEDLDYCRKFFAAAGKPAGERFLRHYTSARDLTGEKGQAIDRKLRGV